MIVLLGGICTALGLASVVWALHDAPFGAKVFRAILALLLISAAIHLSDGKPTVAGDGGDDGWVR